MEKEDREMLIRIDERTKNWEDKVFPAIDKRLDSHAGSIRRLERFNATLHGAWAVIATYFGIHSK